MSAVIVTTTPTIEGKKITSYRGIVTGEAIMGANIFKDLFAGIRDIVGGRSATYERELGARARWRWKRSRPRRPRWAPTRWSAIDIDYETVGTQRQHADGDGQRHRRRVSVSDRGVRLRPDHADILMACRSE